MAHIVKATFVGTTDYQYEKGERYTINISQSQCNKYIFIAKSLEDGTLVDGVAYSGIDTFLNNWDNIKKI